MRFSRQRIWALICIVVVLSLPYIIHAASGHIFFFIIPLGWVVLVRNESFLKLGVTKTNLIKSIAIGIVTGISLGLLAGLILQMAGVEKASLDSAKIYALVEPKICFSGSSYPSASIYMLRQSVTTKGLGYYLLFMLFVVGLGEELFWRGFIQQYIFAHLTKQKALLLTSFIFGLAHIFLFFFVSGKIGILFLLIIIGAGLAWGYLASSLGNIWAAAISHGIAAFILWRFYFFKV